jgi:hypothetical protein
MLPDSENIATFVWLEMPGHYGLFENLIAARFCSARLQAGIMYPDARQKAGAT